MADTTYTFSIATDFPASKLDSSRLQRELDPNLVAIVPALKSINTSGDVCSIIYAAALSGGEETLLNAVIAAHTGEPLPDPTTLDGVPLVSLGRKSAGGIQLVEAALRSGTKTQQISQNFCDKHTWYSTSTRHTGVVMVDSGDGLTWNLPAAPGAFGLVDVTHGRILHERRLRATYRTRVYVDGVEKAEKDPHDDAGDFTVNVVTGDVTFDSSQAGAVVTIDYSQVVNSRWYLRPRADKKLRLASAELQFSTDTQMRDTFIFQLYARVDKFPPLFPYWNQNPLGAPGPYPAGTKLPIGDTVYYHNILDLICEANLAYPLIPKWTGQGSTWRDLKSDVMIFSWDYGEQASIDLDDAWGMEIGIWLEHDVECSGSYGVITFYCLSEPCSVCP